MMSAHSRLSEEGQPNARSATSSPLEDLMDDNDFICKQCSEVDWGYVSTLAADGVPDEGPDRLKVRSLNETSEQLRNSPCKICRILSIIKSARYEGKPCALCAQKASLAFDDFDSGFHVSQATVLCVAWESPSSPEDSWYPDPLMVPLESTFLGIISANDVYDVQPRKTLADSIDYAWLKDLIAYCETDEGHQESCGDRPTGNVGGMKVIDVSTRAIIRRPDEPVCGEYVALSYVWGAEPDGDLPENQTRFSAVVEDALTVTEALGYKYLWVDRYVSPLIFTHPMTFLMRFIV